MCRYRFHPIFRSFTFQYLIDNATLCGTVHCTKPHAMKRQIYPILLDIITFVLWHHVASCPCSPTRCALSFDLGASMTESTLKPRRVDSLVSSFSFCRMSLQRKRKKKKKSWSGYRTKTHFRRSKRSFSRSNQVALSLPSSRALSRCLKTAQTAAPPSWTHVGRWNHPTEPEAKAAAGEAKFLRSSCFGTNPPTANPARLAVPANWILGESACIAGLIRPRNGGRVPLDPKPYVMLVG